MGLMLRGGSFIGEGGWWWVGWVGDGSDGVWGIMHRWALGRRFDLQRWEIFMRHVRYLYAYKERIRDKSNQSQTQAYAVQPSHRQSRSTYHPSLPPQQRKTSSL